VGILSEELAPHAERLVPQPRIYADAKCRPASSRHMRLRCTGRALRARGADLRRAPDVKHYRLAQKLRRTLVTMDLRLSGRSPFPPGSSGGVLIIQAAREAQLSGALRPRRSRAVSGRRRGRTDRGSRWSAKAARSILIGTD